MLVGAIVRALRCIHMYMCIYIKYTYVCIRVYIFMYMHMRVYVYISTRHMLVGAIARAV